MAHLSATTFGGRFPTRDSGRSCYGGLTQVTQVTQVGFLPKNNLFACCQLGLTYVTQVRLISAGARVSMCLIRERARCPSARVRSGVATI